MQESVMLRGAEPREVLQTAIEREVPVILSYLSRGKWHISKVLVRSLGADRFTVEVSPRKKPQPLNIKAEQPVGLSLKYGYGKYVFDTKIVGFEPAQAGGGVIVLCVPDRIEIVQRRNYFRVDVPESLKVNILLWHRRQSSKEGTVPPERYWQGELVDISAGGAQIFIGGEGKSEFRKGQFIGIRFTPTPYAMPLMFDAQIRNILPTTGGEGVCLGIQNVGLEASSEGRQVLSRLAEVVERYYQINQSSAAQHDMQPMHSKRS